MTITLSLDNQNPPTTQRQRIVEKLNSLVKSPGFFKWKDLYLTCGSCANITHNNKAVIFLAIFADSHYKYDGCFTSFGSNGVAFYLKNSLLDKLENALDNLKSMDDINITIN